jgi:hypothetical protein
VDAVGGQGREAAAPVLGSLTVNNVHCSVNIVARK